MHLGKLMAPIGFVSMVLFSTLAQGEAFLNRGNGQEPETLDPHKVESTAAIYVVGDLYEGLTTLSPRGEPVPGVAERWDISPDGRTYTFHLRRDARWSNGDPVTAEDFVYSFRRAVDPATGSSYSPILRPIRNAEPIFSGREADLTRLGVEALDPHRLRIELEYPAPYLLGLLAHPISFPVHRPSVEAYGEAFTRPGNAVTNGAFTIAEWTPQSHVAVVRNPLFHAADSVALDKVVFHATEEPATELKRFRAGEFDLTFNVPVEQLTWIKANLGEALRSVPYLGTYYYGINLTREPLGGRPALREALALAIDRDVLTDKITQGGELPAYSWVPPGLPGYRQQQTGFAGLTQAERDERARKLFGEAGFGPDNPLRLELLYNTSENHKKIAIAIAGMWKRVLGAVEVTMTNQEWKVYAETRKDKDYQIVRASWIGDFADAVNFLDLFLSDAGERNEWGYDNPEFDRLLDQAARSPDPGERNRLMQQAEAILLADLPIIPLFHYTTQHLVAPKVKGWEDNVLDMHPSRYLSLAD